MTGQRPSSEPIKTQSTCTCNKCVLQKDCVQASQDWFCYYNGTL